MLIQLLRCISFHPIILFDNSVISMLSPYSTSFGWTLYREKIDVKSKKSSMEAAIEDLEMNKILDLILGRGGE